MAARMKAVLIKNKKAQNAQDLYMCARSYAMQDICQTGPSEVTLTAPNRRKVQVRAFGLNRMDIMQRKGTYPMPPMADTPQSREILGVEFSGVVSQVGKAATTFKVGDEIFGLVYGGAMAQYLTVPEGMAVRKPAELSWEQAASIPEAWMTAYQAVKWIGGLTQGQRFLFHAGASGVGLSAIQLARHLGALQVFATAGSDEKLAFLKRLGCTDAINYKTQSFVEVVQKATNDEGVNVIVDPVGADYFQGNLQLLARDGRLVILGLMSGSKKEFDIAPVLYKRLRVEGTTLRSRSPEYQGKLLHELMEVALQKFVLPADQGGFDLVIHKSFKATEIVEATLEMEGAKNIGKIVCTW